MGSVATDEVDEAVVEGLWRDDPLVRLLARQVKIHGARVAELETANADLTVQVARLAERVKRLQGKLDGARREAKRQAAPFSKGTKTQEPKRPGRKSGAEYGTRARRKPPPADRVDEHVDVPVPDDCPDCGGQVRLDRVVEQFQEEIVPARTRIRCYHIALGRCTGCRRRVRGRHPDQTSTALGAAGTMLGPVAKAYAAWLHVGLGVAMSKTARILQGLGGLTVTPGGLHTALHGVAGDAATTYQQLIATVRASPAVASDETGWRINGDKAWLWAHVGDGVTVYDITTGRGYPEAARVLGADFAGVIERDGWAPYRKFQHASHQTCVAHLLRRTREMIGDALAGQARKPHQLRTILRDALIVREQHLTGEDLAAAVAELRARIDLFCASSPTHPPNRRLVGHVTNEADHLLTFLTTPGVQATNWRAEQAIRPAVVNRKNWGGNNSWQGAGTTAVIASILRTAHQQHLDPIAVLAHIQTSGLPPADLRMARSP